jgi:hypothetical protein
MADIYRIEYKDEKGHWAKVQGQPEDMDKAAAEKQRDAIQETDKDLELRVTKDV